MQSNRPWDLEAVLMLTARLMISVAVGMVAMAAYHKYGPKLALATEKFAAFAVSTVAFQGMSLVFTHFFLRGEAVSWSEFLDLGHPNLRRALLMGCITGILVVPGALLFNAVSEILLTMLQGQPETQPTVQVLQLTVTVGQRVCFAFAAIVLAPICEEILFRGILYRVLKQFGWPRVALVASSLFFGLIHGNPMTLIPLSFLAVVLALLYDQTDNLMAPIVAHALFNAVNFSTFFLFPK